jgi:hypothetical protein
MTFTDITDSPSYTHMPTYQRARNPAFFILRDASSSSKTRFLFLRCGQTAHSRKINSPYQEDASGNGLDSCGAGAHGLGALRASRASLLWHMPHRDGIADSSVGTMGFVAQEKESDSRILLGS